MKKIIIVAMSVFLLQNTFAQVKTDRSKKPVAGPAPVISLKDPVIFTMPNGMTVLVVENHKLPKVSASLYIDAGPVFEGKKAGIMNLMGQMLKEGTLTMPKDKFDEAVDIIGAEVSLLPTGGNVSALTRYFDKAFILMADALKNPSFPQASFDKLKTQTITGLKANEKSAAIIAERVTNALTYGKQTAQGEFATEETIKALTLDDVKEAYKNYITPSRSYLTFVGDITPAGAKALVTKAFSNWNGKKLTLPLIPDVENPSQTEIDFVDLPTAVQGELSVSNLVNNPMNSPDYHALLLANQILGGGSDGKLFMNLREKHGFTYGSYSRVGSGRFQSMFKATAAVRTDKVDSAIAEMVHEILNMRDGNITREELSITKAKLNGSFALSMENPATIATFASNILINNLPKDFYKTYLQKINNVTIDDIKRVAKNYFSESNARIVIVGNGDKILPNLRRLGYPIKKFDKYANPITDKPKEINVNETSKTADAVSAYTVVENYLTAIGTKEELKKINSLKIELSIEMAGRELEGVNKKMNPNKSLTEMKMGTATVFKSVFDGIKGYTSQMGNKKDFNEDELKEQLDNKGVINHLFYNTADFKTEYMGTAKVNDEDAYKIKVITPSGKLSVEYFSIKTGLLLREETTTKQNDMELSITADFNDYKKVGNVLFPFEIVRTVSEQTFFIKVKEVKINEEVSESDFK